MGFSEDQIKKLLDWYVTSSETRQRWADHRKKALEDAHKWIQPDVIQKLSDEELESKYLEYFKTGAGRQSLNQIYRDRIIRDKKRFRATLLFLLDEKIKIEKRMDEVLDGEYRIAGFGKAIVTSFLMDYNPDIYCLWNNKTLMGFSVLGLGKPYENKDFWGKAYLKVLDELQRLKNLKYDLSFLDIDLFLHTISAEDEGEKAIKALTEGENIISPITTDSIVPNSREIDSMEFAMEKYLEEFIESNFSRINFGAKLELYQDEENSGRQYPTSIGNIDLLAIDNEVKEFVVIELKKGRSSDNVVGQILRYMGWVKENLANDYKVRGVIIVKEKDERLGYALKLMPNVNLFIYSVTFDINKIV